MGDITDQSAVIAAQANIQNTWEELLALVIVEDRDQPLGKADQYSYTGPLLDATSPVVAICLYVYGFESHVYKTLNFACRFKDTEKIKTLGPFATALF